MKIITLVLALASGISAQVASDSPDIGDVYLAKDDGTGTAGEPATSFVTTDIPIYCVVVLKITGPVTVKMNLIAAGVPGVKADTKVVSTSYTTKDGQNEVFFTGRPYGQWAAGTYRADIYLQGTLVKDLVFVIKAAESSVKPAAPSPPKPKRNRPSRKT